MAGSAASGQKAKETMLKRYGVDFFKAHGRVGGMLGGRMRSRGKKRVQKDTNRPS